MTSAPGNSALAILERGFAVADPNCGGEAVEALLVDGGGFDGGSGTFFANHDYDVHAVGSLDPIVPGCVGCIVIRPDGSRYLARAVPDPLANQKPD